MARGRDSAGHPGRRVDQAGLNRMMAQIANKYKGMFDEEGIALPPGDVTPAQVEAANEHYYDDIRRHLMGKPFRSPHLDRDPTPMRGNAPSGQYGMTLEEHKMRSEGAKKPKTGWPSEDPFPFGMRSINE